MKFNTKRNIDSDTSIGTSLYPNLNDSEQIEMDPEQEHF